MTERISSDDLREIDGRDAEEWAREIAEDIEMTWGADKYHMITSALLEAVTRVRFCGRKATFIIHDRCGWAYRAIEKDMFGECVVRGHVKQVTDRDYNEIDVAMSRDVPPLTLAAPLPKASTAAPKADRRNVERVGRILGDGSRRGARTVRRLTVYLPADLAHRLELESAMTGDQKSELVERAVAAYLDAQSGRNYNERAV